MGVDVVNSTDQLFEIEPSDSIRKSSCILEYIEERSIGMVLEYHPAGIIFLYGVVDELSDVWVGQFGHDLDLIQAIS